MSIRDRLKGGLDGILGRPGPSALGAPGERGLLAGKTALVTGAGRNIGRAFAIEMALAGAAVVLTDVDGAAVEDTANEVAAQGGRATATRSDVSSEAEVEALDAWLAQRGVAVDVLVNNVGVCSGHKSVRGTAFDAWRRVFDTNLFGPALLTSRVVESMIARRAGGSIVFVSSLHQWSVMRDPIYSTSKAALGMLVKELAADLAPHRIRVNGVAPGWAAEDERGDGRPWKYSLLHGTSVPFAYVARAGVFLASEHTSMFTTGTVLPVDAGASLFNHRVDEDPPPRPGE